MCREHSHLNKKPYRYCNCLNAACNERAKRPVLRKVERYEVLRIVNIGELQKRFFVQHVMPGVENPPAEKSSITRGANRHRVGRQFMLRFRRLGRREDIRGTCLSPTLENDIGGVPWPGTRSPSSSLTTHRFMGPSKADEADGLLIIVEATMAPLPELSN